LDRTGVVDHLSVMALAVCMSALLLGVLAKWLRRHGVRTEWVLSGVLGLSVCAQAALLFGFPLPSYLLWSLIAAAGAATVLSFAVLTEYFPKEMSGRANAALNLLHVGIAFVLQTAIGLVITQWPHSDGTYPAEAHQAALGALLGLEMAAVAWFVVVAAPRPKPQPIIRSSRLISGVASISTNRRSARDRSQHGGLNPASASAFQGVCICGVSIGHANRPSCCERRAPVALIEPHSMFLRRLAARMLL